MRSGIEEQRRRLGGGALGGRFEVAWVGLRAALSGMLARGSGVRVMALVPGFTRAEFQEVAKVDPSDDSAAAWLEAETVVAACLRDL